MSGLTVSRSGVWTKLCGVRDAATAVALARLRPDAIGLNLHRPSPRFIAVDAAADVVSVLPESVLAVGVFVNTSIDDMLRTVDAVGLAAVQLHGDEPPETVAELKSKRPGLTVLRAWRVGEDGLASLATHLDACERCGALPDAVLVDAKVAGSYGGTGRTAPWELLRDYPPSWPRLILAGGLTPENVAEAIDAVRPWGVDTAGGIERSPGVKDPQLAADFLRAVRGQPSA
ncbi:MAG: phosphoribosylanthranilate isomerase [Planctomycetaceae bacterium]